VSLVIYNKKLCSSGLRKEFNQLSPTAVGILVVQIDFELLNYGNFLWNLVYFAAKLNLSLGNPSRFRLPFQNSLEEKKAFC
jgi:hypothetical protein